MNESEPEPVLISTKTAWLNPGVGGLALQNAVVLDPTKATKLYLRTHARQRPQLAVHSTCFSYMCVFWYTCSVAKVQSHHLNNVSALHGPSSRGLRCSVASLTYGSMPQRVQSTELCWPLAYACRQSSVETPSPSPPFDNK